MELSFRARARAPMGACEGVDHRRLPITKQRRGENGFPMRLTGSRIEHRVDLIQFQANGDPAGARKVRRDFCFEDCLQVTTHRFIIND